MSFSLAGWQVLALVSALVWACVNVVDKYVLSKKFSGSAVACALTGISSLVACAFVLLLGTPAIPSLPVIAALLFTGFLIVASFFFYYEALRAEEVSRVIPVFLLDPIFTALFAGILISEILSPAGYAGIALIVAGTLGLSVKDFKSLRQLKFSKGVLMAFASILLFSLSGPPLKWALSSVNVQTAFFWQRAGVALFAIPFFLKSSKEVKAVFASRQKAGLLFVAASMVSVAAVYIYTQSVSEGLLSVVAALGAIQPLFVLVLAAAIGFVAPGVLEEDTGSKSFFAKLASIAAMAVGTFLVVGG